VYLDHEQFGRTTTKRGDLNPVFNEDFQYEFPGNPGNMVKPPNIKIEVFSEYYFGKVSGAQLAHGPARCLMCSE
jgi:hypothetical protein